MYFLHSTTELCNICIADLETHLREPNDLGAHFARNRNAYELIFRNSEYTLHLPRAQTTEQCTLHITANIRAFPPYLDTWWSTWRVSVREHSDVGALVVAEIQQARERFGAMIQRAR